MSALHFPVVLHRLPIHDETENEMNAPAASWEWQQADEERYRMAVDAINRCAEKGANIDDLKHLARECGVDIKHTILGDTIKAKENR